MKLPYCDVPIQPDIETKARRPDLKLKDKRKRTCELIDMLVATEGNTYKNDRETQSINF